VRELLKTAKVVPVVNQVESHPSLPYHELKAFGEEHGILLSAYSPLGRSLSAIPMTCASDRRLHF
jgi:diketogulonate reductase-like aldo/keto reductase